MTQPYGQPTDYYGSNPSNNVQGYGVSSNQTNADQQNGMAGLAEQVFGTGPQVNGPNAAEYNSQMYGAFNAGAGYQGLGGLGGGGYTQGTPTINNPGQSLQQGNIASNETAEQGALGYDQSIMSANSSNPTVAQTEFQQNLNAGIQSQMAMARSTQGGAASAAGAERAAQQQGATTQAGAAAQSGQILAQEQEAAQQNETQIYGQIGQQEQAQYGLEEQAAEQQAGLESTSQQQQNQMRLGYAGLGNQEEQLQLQALEGYGNQSLQAQQLQANVNAQTEQEGSNFFSGLVGAAGGLIGGLADVHLKEPEGPAHWSLREEPDFILARNERTGELRKLMTEPLSPHDHHEAVDRPHGAGPLGSLQHPRTMTFSDLPMGPASQMRPTSQLMRGPAQPQQAAMPMAPQSQMRPSMASSLAGPPAQGAPMQSQMMRPAPQMAPQSQMMRPPMQSQMMRPVQPVQRPMTPGPIGPGQRPVMNPMQRPPPQLGARPPMQNPNLGQPRLPQQVPQSMVQRPQVRPGTQVFADMHLDSGMYGDAQVGGGGDNPYTAQILGSTQQSMSGMLSGMMNQSANIDPIQMPKNTSGGSMAKIGQVVGGMMGKKSGSNSMPVDDAISTSPTSFGAGDNDILNSAGTVGGPMRTTSISPSATSSASNPLGMGDTGDATDSMSGMGDFGGADMGDMGDMGGAMAAADLHLGRSDPWEEFLNATMNRTPMPPSRPVQISRALQGIGNLQQHMMRLGHGR